MTSISYSKELTEAERQRYALRASWRIAMIAFIGGLGGGVVFPILPIMGTRLGLSAAMIGVILSSNRLTRIIFNPVTGALLDRFGARWPVVTGLVIEGIATIAFSIALRARFPTAWFLGGRIMWGIGSSLLIVGCLAAVMILSRRAERGRLTSRVRTASSLGLPGGLVVGGIVADVLSPNTAFLGTAALSFGGAFLAMWTLPRGKPPIEKQPASTSSKRWSEWRKSWSEMLKVPILQVIWFSNGLIFFAVSGVLLTTLVILINQRHLLLLGFDSQGSAGILMACLMACRGSAALAIGTYLDKVQGRTALLIPAIILVAAGFAGLGLAHQVWTVSLALVAAGFGSGAIIIPLLTLLGDIAPRHLRGSALAIYQASGDFGGTLGPIIGMAAGTSLGFGITYFGVAACMVAASLPLFWLVLSERKSQSTDST